MKSPLDTIKSVVKEYKIPKEAELHPRQKIAFLEDQLQQLKGMQWRSIVDVIHAKRLQESKNEVLKNKGFTNESEHRNQVQQFTGAILMIQTLIEELRAENPAVGATVPSDVIEA